MLVFIPVLIGSGIGILMLFLTKLLRTKGAFLSRLPSVLGLIAFVVLILISFYVKGFEGAAYAFLSVTVLIFTIISFILTTKNKVA